MIKNAQRSYLLGIFNWYPSESKVLLFKAIGNLLFSVEIEIIELG
jgi:hypothetical protein